MSNRFINQTVLYAVLVAFIVIVLFRVIYSYSDVQAKEYEFAKKESEVLGSYAMAHRTYYQQLFIDGVLKLNAKTLPALPARSSFFISEIFSSNNVLNIEARTVSDRARNIENLADKSEMEAIKYLNKNINEKDYFSEENSEYYQYAYALKIEPVCLKCHGSRENAPEFIRNTYENAYDYKLGEVRGIVSIKIPKLELNNYFLGIFYYSIAYDIFLLSLLFIFIYYLMQKFKNINTILNSEVRKKTYQLTQSNSKLEMLLIKDKLTNKYNRNKLLDDINQNIDKKDMHLVLINIDRFKEINDFYGHDIADEILKDLANKLDDTCKDNNWTMYKLPSDEFAILSIEEIDDKKFLMKVELVLEKFTSTQFQINEHSIYLTFSCGIACGINDILVKTDMALQKARTNKENIILYDDSMDVSENLNKNLKGLGLLKEAIANDTIIPFFQPIYNLQTDKIEKYESLARIISKDGIVVSPHEFMDIAIKSKLYPHITRLIIEKSFAYFEDKDYEFSINFSMDDVRNKDTIKFIEESLRNFKKPQNVVFEILESEEVDDYDALKAFIKKLKQFGSKVAIDDFGSGYSNFAYIMELNIDYIKIDASLIKNITTSKDSRVITKTIINFAKSLNMKTISEFVEDKESLDLLREMGSDYAQGYYIGKPSADIV